MTARWYLGRNVYDPLPNRLHARIQPRAMATGGTWRSYGNWTDHFPNEGKVFSPNHPQGLSEAFFAFDVVEVTDISKQDRFRLQTFRKAEEVLDYSDRDPEDVRRIFVEHGVPARKADKETVVVVLPDDLCVRVSLVRDGDGKKSVAELIDLAALPLYSFDRSLFDGDRIDGSWYSVPDITVGLQQGTIDWSLDKDFIASLLRQLKRLSAPEPGEQAYPVSKSQIQVFLNTLDRHGLLPAAKQPWNTDGQRVRRLSSDMRFELAEIDELVSVLSSLSPVEDKLSQVIEARRKTLEAELTANIEAEIRGGLEARYEDLSKRNRELDETVARRELEKAALEEAEASLVERRGRIHREIHSLIANLASALERRGDGSEPHAERLIQDIENVLRGERVVVSRSTPGPPRSILPPFDYGMDPMPWEALNEKLAAASSQHGFQPRDIETLDLLARSGEVVLLSPDIAESVLHCYASVISQGGFVVQSLDPSTLGHDDLWRSPAKETATPLSQAWSACSGDPAVARLVLLEGIERTPLDLWLRPLVDTLRSPRRPKNLLVFFSMGSAAVARDRNVSDLPDLVIPFNPRKPDPLNANFVRCLFEDRDGGLWFDFEAKPAVARAEIAGLLGADYGPAGKERMPFALRASVAARGTGIPDTAKRVRALCENLDANSSDQADRIEGLVLGREYLRTLLN